VILLDDGFQHRRLLPSLSILLADSNRPVFEDRLLPAGLLREPLKGKDRASIVLVTKCSPDMQPIDFRIYTNGLDLFPYQQLYFTTFEYDDLKPVFPEMQSEMLSLYELRKKHVFLVTGIASPTPLVDKLEHKTYNLYTKFFPDHHSFTKEDIQSIHKMVQSVEDDNKIILTTEKDAVRFRALPFLDDEMKRYSIIFRYVSPLLMTPKENHSTIKYLNMLEIIKQTADYLKNKIGDIPNTAIILGTGLGDLANEIADKKEIPYTEIPNFPVSTVEGHSGKLIIGTLGSKKYWRCRVASIITKDTT